MAERTLDTPTAIVIAGALVAVGAFLGLRSRTVAPGPAAAPTVAERPRAPEAPGTVPRAEVARAIAAALEKQRPALVDKCWKPSATATPPPKPARLVFTFTVGADGRQLARGVQEERGAGAPEITSCVLQSLAPVAVGPPGATVEVEVPFGLP